MFARSASAMLLVLCLLATCPQLVDAAPPTEAAELRAIAFLSKQVPAWSVENKCFSCHNNGDGARALLMAVQRGAKLEPAVLRSTLAWLQRPAAWERKDNKRFDDKRLAAIQFAAAQRTARQAGLLTDRKPLLAAARLVAAGQAADGGWKIGAQGELGSPTAYGAVLGTAVAVQTLQSAVGEASAASDDRDQIKAAAARGEAWLRRANPKNVTDAAGVIIGLGKSENGQDRRANAWRLLRRTHNKQTGGWGPFGSSPSEPFDTAISVLAISQLKPTTETRRLITAGRAYLTATQLDDGGWPETTRPGGGQSYAQHISTSAWVAIALLQTSEAR